MFAQWYGDSEPFLPQPIEVSYRSEEPSSEDTKTDQVEPTPTTAQEATPEAPSKAKDSDVKHEGDAV